jgi:hypothetical protein
MEYCSPTAGEIDENLAVGDLLRLVHSITLKGVGEGDPSSSRGQNAMSGPSSAWNALSPRHP